MAFTIFKVKNFNVPRETILCSTPQEKKEDRDVGRAYSGNTRRLSDGLRIDGGKLLASLGRERFQNGIIELAAKLDIVEPQQLVGKLTLTLDISGVFDRHLYALDYLVAAD